MTPRAAMKYAQPRTSTEVEEQYWSFTMSFTPHAAYWIKK